MEVKAISKGPDKKKDDQLVNEAITAEKVLLISEDGEQLGIHSRVDALKIAEERGYDLVCVAPGAKTPVCKLLDYSKFRYEQQRRAREARKKQHIIAIKEIRLSPNIDNHDFQTKARNARKFLTDGNKVKVTLRFRGRTIVHSHLAKPLFERFAEGLADVSNIETQPVMDGRSMLMMLAPIIEKKK
ncbi:MAG: translation initiation factor IF-3 [Bacilli bacterium]|jgi:translation initiation factor IF-3|nr:translation initiation factor IF-3 [Acholeplasmataceae bacterium]